MIAALSQEVFFSLMPPLPVEIWIEITQNFTFAEKNTLIALLYTSKVLHVAAERQLYTSIIAPTDKPSKFDQQAFFKRIASDERVAKFIRVLHVGCTPPRISEHMLDVFWADCFAALHAVENLQELSFAEEPSRYAPFEDYIFPFRLKTFIWHVPSCQPPLLRFLARQPSLIRLEFTWCLRKVELQGLEEELIHSLSNISILRGPQELVLPLLRGSHIKHLYIKNLNRDAMDPSLLPKLERTQSIQTLVIDDNHYYVPFLHNSAYLPNLVRLQLFAPDSADLYATCELPKLESFIIRRRAYGRDVLPSSLPAVCRLAELLFKLSSSLSSVQVESDSPPRMINHWSRGSLLPDSVSVEIMDGLDWWKSE
ncbi:hypothetical protein HGRIS_000731 [Hohenbuehelia grisea]|uniref:F-box domain-containing protein n=1 Tax=Hohenbuehelia grisea TaxID=104357 RepID=A0ABR3IPK6_9AGAR